MVCDDCKSRLSTLAAPDPFKRTDVAASSAGPSRVGAENKLLRKNVRSNPYMNSCKICKMKVQQNSAQYCTICAYAKGICAVCGKQVLDTSMYKMSEGGNQWHTVRPRDEASFKSEQQITREGAQAQLLDYLTQTGQVGRMPTRVALERAGHRELAASLIACFGGLHAAADAMGLSKRLLNEEMEARKQAKREAAQMSAEAANEAAARAAEATDAADAAQPHAADADERCLEHSHGQTAATQDAPVDDDLPPGVAVCAPCAPCAPSVTATVGAVDAPPAATVATANVAQDPASQAGNVSHPAGSGRSLDARWQYDPNNALYYQLSTQCYFSAEKWMYNKHGQWSATKPA